MNILATNKNVGAKTQAQRNTWDVIRTILGLVGSLLIALNWVPAEEWANLTGAVEVIQELWPALSGAVLTIYSVISSFFNEEEEEVAQRLNTIG